MSTKNIFFGDRHLVLQPRIWTSFVVSEGSIGLVPAAPKGPGHDEGVVTRRPELQPSELLRNTGARRAFSANRSFSRPTNEPDNLTPWVFPIPGNGQFVITSQHPETIVSPNSMERVALRAPARHKLHCARAVPMQSARSCSPARRRRLLGARAREDAWPTFFPRPFLALRKTVVAPATRSHLR